MLYRHVRYKLRSGKTIDLLILSALFQREIVLCPIEQFSLKGIVADAVCKVFMCHRKMMFIVTVLSQPWFIR